MGSYISNKPAVSSNVPVSNNNNDQENKKLKLDIDQKDCKIKELNLIVS